MEHVTRIGLDTSKRLFQLHGVDAAERPVLRRKLTRSAMVALFEGLSPTVVALEACGASHHWARKLSGMGHEVRLIAPQLAKPYVKRNKNDAADAEAQCEAAGRPTMRFVPMKSAEQQADLMLAGMRERLGRRRTQLSNTQANKGPSAHGLRRCARNDGRCATTSSRNQTTQLLPQFDALRFG